MKSVVKQGKSVKDKRGMKVAGETEEWRPFRCGK